jgi:anti-sigma factor RsiW
MDRSFTTDKHYIRRIVTVLLALADLAECTSDRSAAVRGLVLWLLRSGEVLAREYLAGLTRYAAGEAEPLRLTDDSAAEAIRLATSFHKLAAILAALAVDIPAPQQQTRVARLAARAAVPAALGSLVSAVGRRDSS